jgi:hypothetical protein
MSQVRVAKGIPNQSVLKQTRFSNSLASKKTSGHPKKQKYIYKYQQDECKGPSEMAEPWANMAEAANYSSVTHRAGEVQRAGLHEGHPSGGS